MVRFIQMRWKLFAGWLTGLFWITNIHILFLKTVYYAKYAVRKKVEEEDQEEKNEWQT